jgi:predicted transcriptional regulator
MTRWSRISSILLVAVTLTALLLPGMATARYIVEPMAEEYSGEWHDLEEIVFWSLPPRATIIHFLLTVLPGVPYVGELFYVLSLLLPLGFRRVMRHNVLDDDFRHDLYRQITLHPGASTRELRELTGASRGRLRYHLDVLIREGKVATMDYRNRFRHFARNRRYTTLEKRTFGSLRDETPGAILAHLLRSPDATQNDIAEELGLSGPTVFQHMQQFEAEGIVAVDREERTFRYRLSRGAREALNKYQIPSNPPPSSPYPGLESHLGARGREVPHE